MNVYKEIKQLSELNEQRKELIKILADKVNLDDIDINSTLIVKGCIENDGHLYDHNGCPLDNSGLINDDYYCWYRTACIGDVVYDARFYATDVQGVFVALLYKNIKE